MKNVFIGILFFIILSCSNENINYVALEPQLVKGKFFGTETEYLIEWRIYKTNGSISHYEVWIIDDDFSKRYNCTYSKEYVDIYFKLKNKMP